MPPRTLLVLALALIATPLHAAETAPAIPACPLLGVAEVGAAFDETVEAAEQAPVGGGPGEGRMTTCFWTPAGGALGATVSLSIWSWPPGHPGAAGLLATAHAADYPGRPPPEAVALGDDAVWDGDRLHVRDGQVTFTLAASLNALDDAPDARPALEGLAATVLGRLP